MTKPTVIIAAFLLLLFSALAYGQSADNPEGFLDKPPVFIDNEPDIPLTGMGTAVPPPGKVIPAVRRAEPGIERVPQQWSKRSTDTEPEV